MSRNTLDLPGLRYLRNLQRETQQTIAQRAETTTDAISRLETGKRRAYRRTAKRIATALGVTVAMLQYRWEDTR